MAEPKWLKLSIYKYEHTNFCENMKTILGQVIKVPTVKLTPSLDINTKFPTGKRDVR